MLVLITHRVMLLDAISFIMLITNDLFSFIMTLSHLICFLNLLIITVYLGSVANLDLSVLGYVRVKFLWIVCRFAVTEGKLEKPTVTDGSCQFLSTGSKQRRE